MGNSAFYDVNGNPMPCDNPNVARTNDGPFFNLMRWPAYWSGSTNENRYIVFSFGSGGQDPTLNFGGQGVESYAWPVRDGDVAPSISPVQEPSTMLLLASSLVGLGVLNGKFGRLLSKLQ